MPSHSTNAKVAAAVRLEGLSVARPENDVHIAHSYSLKNLRDKRLNRVALLTRMGWEHASWPILFIPLHFANHDGVALVRELLPAVAEQELSVIILGPEAGALGAKASKRLSVEEGSEALFHLALAGTDMLLLPGVPQPAMLPQALAWRYGTVPLVAAEHSLNGVADNYDPVMESGTSFLAATTSVWGMHAALVRALETFRLPYDWRGIQRNAMETDWSS